MKRKAWLFWKIVALQFFGSFLQCWRRTTADNWRWYPGICTLLHSQQVSHGSEGPLCSCRRLTLAWSSSVLFRTELTLTRKPAVGAMLFTCFTPRRCLPSSCQKSNSSRFKTDKKNLLKNKKVQDLLKMKTIYSCNSESMTVSWCNSSPTREFWIPAFHSSCYLCHCFFNPRRCCNDFMKKCCDKQE